MQGKASRLATAQATERVAEWVAEWVTERVTVWATALAITAATAAHAAVYRCIGPDDRVHYQQFGCPAHSVHEPLDLPETSFITAAPLTDLERAQLARLESRLESARQLGLKDRARRNAAAQKAREESERLCAQAQTNLEKLAALRRGGYAASEDRALSREEMRWERAEKESC